MNVDTSWITEFKYFLVKCLKIANCRILQEAYLFS